MTMNDSRFLASTLDAQMLKTTIKLTIAVNRNLTNVDETTTNLAGIGLLHRERTTTAQQVKYVRNTDVFCFGFNFMSPKWT